MAITRVNLTCPHCGKHNDCHENMTQPGAVPQPGALSLCIGCGGWGVFTVAGLRLPTPKEQADISADRDCQRHVSAWQAMDLYRRVGAIR